MKRITLILTILLIGICSMPAAAQFEIGASYELRDENPENGFGIRIQKGLFESLPVVNLGVRLHASYFSDENNLSRNGVSYSQDLTNYDVGIAAYGGVGLGLLEPYAGVGLGTENFESVIDNYSGSEELTGEESGLYWNTFVGAKVTIIPMLKPFVEYRYSDKELSSPKLQDAQSGRIAFGILISF